MRPHSIVMFERLFLAAMALNVLGFVFSYQAVADELARQPGLSELGLTGGFAIGVFSLSLAVYLLLWFLIARKGSAIAKWILIALVAIGLTTLPSALSAPFTWGTVFGLLVTALEVAALVFLFREDAKAWLRREDPADPPGLD
ncbi:hypothetical protein [Altericroceibacterium xinjiangense]|uniref:hypothetical protein n=1 Tax=Altericroceibacterium xinjiangense TaxID=762261 RepID=UPI000F7DB9E6|nr:hypothetical protein [Altericroceibacterium xinjiangense]